MAQYVYTMHRLSKVVPPKREILKNISLSFFPGAKIGVLGLNGSGKSTLLKIMAGVDTEFDGEARPMPELNVGYLPQEPQLDPNKTVREVVEEAVSVIKDAQARLDQVYAEYAEPDADFDKLAAEQAKLESILQASDGHNLERQLEVAADALRLPAWDAKVSVLSGGEKRRVALCRLLLSAPDMLLLDEPTNHLDLEMRLALTMALQEFGGAVLVVSHDRHLLKSTTDDFLLVADGRVQEFDGDLDDYTRWLADYRLRNAPVSNTPVNADKTDKKAQRQQAAALRQQLAPHKREADKLERDLGLVNEKLAKVEEALADSTNYEAANKDKLRDLLAEQAKLKVRESELEDAWMQALELLESMQAELEALS
ncbi:ATP-binding cassette domain-containing protein [Pseudomonas syringae]|uniref:ATP-binding cassette domain-containing protein n=1 Tax=Pseudomonas syringae TaxID=317 RepID=UPI000EFF70B8|nr:ATP-binding cassette domain-containing protein [Pseudomonas syringae]RMR97390.1 hypothetical protein ALP75_200002 [Pseudomonas syringae pv. actinidiae]